MKCPAGVEGWRARLACPLPGGKKLIRRRCGGLPQSLRDVLDLLVAGCHLRLIDVVEFQRPLRFRQRPHAWPALHLRRSRQGSPRAVHGSQAAALHNPVMKAFRQRLQAKGKKRKVAIVVIMRKLLTTLNARLRDERQWSPASTF